MVTFDEFEIFSGMTVTASDFPKVERTSVDLLSCLCGKSWDYGSDVCKKAVMYQIEYIVQLGGLTAWNENRGVVGSRSYTIGGESESVTYMQSSKESEAGKTFHGVPVSPLAWALLQNAGILSTVRKVRVW